jgi:hypothetical protein
MSQFPSDLNQPLQPSNAPAPLSAESASPMRRRWLLWVMGSVAVLVILCLAGTLVGGIGLFQNSQQESNGAIKVVDQFMQDGVHKDPGAGINLFSQTARDQGVTQDSIAKLFNVRNDLFQGYKSLQQETFNIQSGTQGTIASLAGTVSYTGQADKKFTATLRKEDGQWKLVSIRFPEGVGS